MPTPTAATFDMHLHTTRHSPDGEMNPFALARKAKQLGLTGIVITEHDWLWTNEELDELRAATPQIQIYGGIEVSAAEGHFLVYGIHDPHRLPKSIPVVELCTEVHRQRGAVVAAHPYRWGQDFDEIVYDQKADLDGLEIMSLNMDEPARVKAATVQKDKKWAGLGNSDAHKLEDVGYCYTAFPSPIRDVADLVEALRSGNGQARKKLDLKLLVEMDE